MSETHYKCNSLCCSLENRRRLFSTSTYLFFNRSWSIHNPYFKQTWIFVAGKIKYKNDLILLFGSLVSFFTEEQIHALQHERDLLTGSKVYREIFARHLYFHDETWQIPQQDSKILATSINFSLGRSKNINLLPLASTVVFLKSEIGSNFVAM